MLSFWCDMMRFDNTIFLAVKQFLYVLQSVTKLTSQMPLRMIVKCQALTESEICCQYCIICYTMYHQFACRVICFYTFSFILCFFSQISSCVWVRVTAVMPFHQHNTCKIAKSYRCVLRPVSRVFSRATSTSVACHTITFQQALSATYAGSFNCFVDIWHIGRCIMGRRRPPNAEIDFRLNTRWRAVSKWQMVKSL